MAGSRNRRGGGPDIWPGFVDALASLLMVVIFLLMVFVLAQVFLSEALSGRDEQLQRLDRELADLGAMLAIERDANRELRDTVGRLSADLRASTAARDSLREQLATMTRQAEAASDTVERLRSDLAEAEERVSADKEKIELQLVELAALQEQIAALRKVRDDIEEKLAAADRTIAAGETRVASQEAELENLQRTVAGLEAARKALEDRLAAAAASEATARASAADSGKALEESRDALEKQLAEVARLDRLREAVETARIRLEQELADEREKLAAQGRKLAAEQDASRASREEVERLTMMVAELRRDLARLNEALEASEEEDAQKDAQIVDLGQRLNRALASKVEELARYRSEFFGKLREAIGDRQEIRIVGDRFVFQSEVLFASGVATLGDDGQEQIRKLAATLTDIAGQIPPNIPWILRVDGHTDPVPIRTERFASNWELSTARALAVVRRLIELGVPPSRLAATGFGEYQPLDPTPNSEIAYRRNRRIEFKLTEP